MNKIVLAALSLLIAASAFTSYAFSQLNRQSRDGAIARQALCAFKTDLQERVNGSLAFLIQHPNGFAGVDVATIRTSIANQQATLRSLAVLHCRKD